MSGGSVFADISHYQTLDLVAYKAAGYDRVFMKATEGTSYVDPVFADRWRRAGQLGLARGVYHFGRSGNGVAEWRHFIATVKAAGGVTARDILILDQEDPGKEAVARAHAGAFTHAAVGDGYSTGGIYTGRWFAEPAHLSADAVEPGWRRLWLSDYGSAADSRVTLPTGWTYAQLIARQYTDATRFAGIAAPCDGNRVVNEWLQEGDVTMNSADIDALCASQKFRLMIREQVTTALADPTHSYLQDELQPLKDDADALTTRIDSLAGKVESIGNDVTEIKTAIVVTPPAPTA